MQAGGRLDTWDFLEPDPRVATPVRTFGGRLRPARRAHGAHRLACGHARLVPLVMTLSTLSVRKGPASEPAGIALDTVASLLRLSAADAKRLAAGEAFDGPSGLRCRLEIERADGRVVSARPTVMLGIKANDLAGDEVHLLLTLQARLLSHGLWYLGAGAAGELQVTALHCQHSAEDTASAIDMANFTAWSTLQIMLESLPLARVDLDREKMQ